MGGTSGFPYRSPGGEKNDTISDAINAHLGFRGYLMMMRLQRASNLRDLHDLLPDLAQALVKRLGVGAATPLVQELQRLIAHGN